MVVIACPATDDLSGMIAGAPHREFAATLADVEGHVYATAPRSTGVAYTAAVPHDQGVE